MSDTSGKSTIPILRILSILLLLFNGTGAIYGGWKLISDPDGESLGLSLDYLQHTPFTDYLIPGLVLLIMNGLLSMVTAGLVLSRTKAYPLWIIFQGLVLTAWIIIQLIMIQFIYFLHLVMGGTGILLLVFGFILYRQTGKVH